MRRGSLLERRREIELTRERAPRLGHGAARYRDIPIFRRTACTACGTDQGVAVRYRDAVLCLDCYRGATRQARERRRRLRMWLRQTFAAHRSGAVARRCLQSIAAAARRLRWSPERSFAGGEGG